MSIKKRRLAVLALIAIVIVFVISNSIFIRFYYVGLPKHRLSEEHFTPIRQLPNDNSPITILAINGGGMRALIPLSSLVYLEQKTGQPISALFDTIIATSSGGIIAAGLAVPDEHGKPRYTAAQISDIFTQFHFDLPWYHRLLTLGGLVGPRFTGESLHTTMEASFGNTEMRQLLTQVILPVFSATQKEVVLITRDDAVRSDSNNYFVSDVINAGTAAPVMLPAMQLDNVLHEKSIVAYDAALFLENPALRGLIHTLRMHPHRKVLLISLGTGTNNFTVDAKELHTWGLFSWSRYLANTLLDQNDNEVNQELTEILNNSHVVDGDFYSINVLLTPKQGNPFSTKPQDINNLIQNGQESVRLNKAKLDVIAAELLANQQLRAANHA